MFEGFELENVDVGEATLRVRHGGSGPPLVLLHGHPRTHTTWYDVAPRLADAFTVVCPDLPGYGQSSKLETTDDHSAHSKRAMANDIVALMKHLGHDRFAVAGHDRGSAVAYRLAFDHPEAVTKLAILDGIPIGEHLSRADAKFALAWWHWFFFGQLEKPAERVINADPDAWYGGDPAKMGAENHADFLRAIHDPETVHAMLEDYRAGLGPDRAADDADKAAGNKIACPVLVLWSSLDDLGELYGDPVAVWHEWAEDVRGFAIESGHHVAEEKPAELAAALREFLA
ncbi:alpha/beta fold hydrolase [Amycolatopsis regifaucium]|uniref:Alpha/beta hydrolase n=1 Tax=Amycolatopsis regifaucium TaxID=546365 RepID=A0A154ML56_9PSEU|nr:alpha/beta hydrolase [Amycolatopsis regifaucium]KZB85025.1 alpha/beta hydrolase [Amycolatopsis regifaucium]OKA04047.1 alpha/beta hydrolase [Amycolatopsis regifaucium]SFH96750.1 haloacetate dehalogenase [Amycolatopsis regifaucium]